MCAEVNAELIRHDAPVTRGAAVNAGLRRALEHGRDALVVAPDVLFVDAGWVEAMRARTDGEGRPAAVAGARLLYPTGLLARAGLMFSPLTPVVRRPLPLRAGRPAGGRRARDLPGERRAAADPASCLASVGLYDEALRAGRADVDYCLRVFAAGLECVYEPTAWALIQQPDMTGAQDPAFHARSDAATAELHAKHGDAALLRLRAERAVTDLPRTLFVGGGKGAVCWYRCALPAIYLDLDWIGVGRRAGVAAPGDGPAGPRGDRADWTDYEVIVIQQPRGRAWVERIRELQAAGVKVRLRDRRLRPRRAEVARPRLPRRVRRGVAARAWSSRCGCATR